MTGQLGTGDFQTRPLPDWISFPSNSPNVTSSCQSFEIQSPESSVIQSICAGWKHSVLLSSAGRVFVCGANQYGQLARPVATKVSQSKTSSRLDKAKSDASSSAPLASIQIDSSSGSTALVNSPTPTLASFPDASVRIQEISAGWHHVAALGMHASGILFLCVF
jgi:hypothetical protein